jgi:hypothetical protein
MDPRRLGPNPVTIADMVASGQRLELWCCNHGCHRTVSIPPVVAAYLVGAATPVPLAANRFRCSVCGGRGRDGLVTARPDVADFWDARHAIQRQAMAAETQNAPGREAEGVARR